MTSLHQLRDLFVTSWWEDTWLKGAADMTVNPLINGVERVGVGLSMSGAMAISSDVRDEVDKFMLAAQTLGDICLGNASEATEAMLTFVLPVFMIWYESLPPEGKKWVLDQLSIPIQEMIVHQSTMFALKEAVKKMFRTFLLRKITGFAEMSAAMGALVKARGGAQTLGAARKILEAMGKEAVPEKGRFALVSNNPAILAAKLLSWIPYTAQRSMVEAKKFERTFPNVYKYIKALPKARMTAQDWVYLYFLFGDKLNLLFGFAEDVFAGRLPSFEMVGVRKSPTA